MVFFQSVHSRNTCIPNEHPPIPSFSSSTDGQTAEQTSDRRDRQFSDERMNFGGSPSTAPPVGTSCVICSIENELISHPRSRRGDKFDAAFSRCRRSEPFWRRRRRGTLCAAERRWMASGSGEITSSASCIEAFVLQHPRSGYFRSRNGIRAPRRRPSDSPPSLCSVRSRLDPVQCSVRWVVFARGRGPLVLEGGGG